MHTSLAESRDHLLQALDDEIISLEESTRALRSRRNALAPISRLPPETLAAIFSLLPPPALFTFLCKGHLAWICVTHVCRKWRETALNHPYLWSHINFTRLTPVAMAEILARTKMEPLYLGAAYFNLSAAQLDTFEKQLEVHISHTRHLNISAHLQSTLDRLVSPAPILEFLSLSHASHQYKLPQVVIPINLFNGTVPSLTSLELENCNISWKSPLLKGLRTLKIFSPSTEARPKVEDWLGALNEMPQLETLILENATPIAPPAVPLISEPSRAVTLPSLTRFHISASAKDCALALAHLMLPALTELHVDAKSHDGGGEDVRLIIPYVARNLYGLQDTELRSLLIGGCRTSIIVRAWTIPGIDFDSVDPNLSFNASVLDTRGSVKWLHGVDTAITDALLTIVPVNSVSTLTTRDSTRLSKEFWLSHVPSWPLLERVCLVPTTIKAFRDMLVEDAPPDGPRLPSLTKITLTFVKLTAPRTFHLCDMLMERVEQGVPLEVLDLHLCIVADRAIRLFKEIVVDVQMQPAAGTTMEEPTLLNWNGGIGYCGEVEYYDKRVSHDGIYGYEDEAEYDSYDEVQERYIRDYYGLWVRRLVI
ncbi:hypothetical protein DFH94DRAFT_825642 [Russula ochroleuca]|jgi:hypothetical protein|uniref:F-box domain-containing protein n=1 Tax=Russula ochroleuca TaxID=152965 RepID=A0A9P5TAK5_9AGAM|nr:hypothetical protein DFH94DRAFT_825642 [Russula ochroleuca]